VAVVVRDAEGERRITLLAVLTGAADDLVTALRATLPPAAVPHRVQPLAALPLTAAGKIDHVACSELVAEGAPASGAETGTLADPAAEPVDRLQAALLAQWRTALNAQVGLDDDFVAAGGDSMTSLALACQAPGLGVTIRPRDIFEAGSVRALAQRIMAGNDAAGPATAGARPESAAVADAGLTPAVHWLIDRLGEVPGPWGQYVLLKLAGEVDAEALRRTIEALPHRYPAFRTAIRQVDGEWRAEPVEATGGCWSAESVPVLDDPTIARIRDQATAWLDPAIGRHLRAVLLHGPDGDRRLLLVAHHAAVDVVSWRLLMNELETSYHLVRSGWSSPAVTPAPAVADWIRDLRAAAAAGAFDDDHEHWAAVVSTLAGDGVPGDAGIEGEARTVAVTVPLAGAANPAEPGGLADVVLAAALTAWQRWSGRGRCVVEMESPGRDAAAGPAGYDVVGWLTAMYPVPVELSGEPEKNLAAVRSAAGAVPGDGSGYGVLRYLHPDPGIRDGLRLPVSPDVSANFRGRTSMERTALLAAEATVQAGPARGGHLRRPCPVVIDGWVDGGALTVAVELNGRAVDEETAEGIRSNLEVALRALLVPRVKELPLTPAQEGILFHAVQSSAPDAYVGQIAVELTGAFDQTAFTAAWQAAALATPPLRTSFAWRRQLAPSQRIAPTVELPVRCLDWSARTGTVEQLATELTAEERTPFDLEAGPLLRVALANLADGRQLAVVTHHHLVFDGWSMNLLVGDLLTAYAQLRSGQPARLAVRAAAAELVSQAPARGPDDFWARHLAGARPTRLVDPERRRSGVHQETTVRLSGQDWDDVRLSGRQHRLAPATLLHLAWASTLRERLGQDDVTFGTVLSGRDSRIPGIEAASGMLINTLPLRVRFGAAAGESLAQLAATTAADLLALQERQGASLVEVRRRAGIGPRDALFDHLLDFGTSRTMVTPPAAGVAGLRLRPLNGFERTNYGITITAVAAADLELSVNHDDGLLPVPEAEDLLAHLTRAIRSIAGVGAGPAGRTPAPSQEGDGQ
jgi:non-ribosomal peptide synthase protein (TIGR01720 family)